ncbi:MAG: flagellar basal-body MS-ring/collar protein FliF [Oleiphilaceae bacterium]|nr:flagellar basal-body MS-ring/collar protein FliF [Oleiphilaceae bacterium]
MAIVPTEANVNLPASTDDTPDIPAGESDLMTGINRLSLFRQIGLMVGLAASVALGLALVLWLQEPDYQPLMQDIAAQDIEEVSRILNLNNINFKVEPRTGMLLVESSKVYEARIKLAAAEITPDRNVGYELLDKEQGLGTSQFMESTRFKRGLEGELSRTISSFRNIRNARVHLAIPKRSVFVRDNRSPSASVLIEASSMNPVSREQVDAIVNLVAGSVPEMDKSQVTVVDQKGNLLSRNNESEEDRMVAREFEYSRKIESVLNGRISSILDPIVGNGRFRSEVSADVDFTAVEETEELYNPDMQAIRSEQTLDEQRQMMAEGGVPGALTNQPPAAGAAPQQAGGAGGDDGGVPTNLRKQTTRNYEVDRTISYTRHQQGRLKRLTVAVAIDDIRSINPETGEVKFTPWSEQELERLTILVRNAVGYSAARGDSVTVINTPFAPQEIEPFVEPPMWEQGWFWDAVWKGVAILVALIVIFTVIRPTFKNLADAGAQAKELALAGDEDGLAQLDQMDEGEAGERVMLSAADEFLLPGASEGYDKQLNALKGLVAEDPARVAQVIRQWVNEDG